MPWTNRTELGCLITDLSQCIKSKTMNDVTLFVFPRDFFPEGLASLGFRLNLVCTAHHPKSQAHGVWKGFQCGQCTSETLGRR